MIKSKHMRYQRGFTIVELLIVIVVIAILAAVTVVAYNGMQERARQSKIESDLSLLERAIDAARHSKGTQLRYFVNLTHTGGPCYYKASGTDLSKLSETDTCISTYRASLKKIFEASGIDVQGLLDPWGRPYYIDENEAESSTTPCTKDKLAVYALPHVYSSQAALKNQRLLSNTFQGC